MQTKMIYMHQYLSASLCIYACDYISATFEGIGNSLAAAESGVFNESGTKVSLTIYQNMYYFYKFGYLYLNDACFCLTISKLQE